MSGSSSFDLLIQLRASVVADTFIRVLNDPLTTNPQSGAALPRRLSTPVPALLLWWDAPGLALNDDGTITVSLALAGGMRQAPAPGDLGRIATISGTLKARMKPVVGQLADVPQIALELETIDQSGLRANYAGSNALPLVGVGGAPRDIVESVVRDAVSTLIAQPLLISFLRDLGQRPITLSNVAFPPAPAPTGTDITMHWPRSGEVFAIGSAQPGVTSDLAGTRLGLLDRSHSNAAVTVSSARLSAKLQSLLASGALVRALRDEQGNAIAEVQGMEVRVGAGELSFTTRVTSGSASGTLDAGLALALDTDTGRATVAVRRMKVDLDTVPAGVSQMANAVAALTTLPNRLERGYWLAVMARLLGAEIDGGRLDLTQRYSVPGTQVAVSGRATALEQADDALTIYAALPTDAMFVPQPPHRQPKVVAAQDPLHIPTQSAPGQPVEATVAAMLRAPSYEPYDYAWDADHVEHITGEHGQTFTVRGTPPGTGAIVEELTKASVTVIDSFGQTDDASAPVLVRSAQHKKPRPHPRKLARIAVPALLAAIVIIGAGLAFAGIIPPRPPSLPPVLVVTPKTDYQQTCTPAVSSLPSIFVTLDNSRNAAAISWTASAQGAVPGGTEAWASLNDSGATASGTIGGKHVAVLTIQPASDLCAAVQSAGTQQQFTVSITYSLAGSGALRQNSAAAPAVVASAAPSRQITVKDAIGITDFSAYVLNADRQPVTTFAQSCDQTFATAPSELLVVLDNSRSTNAAQWQLTIPDQVPITASPVEPWASAATLAGTVDAGQRSRVVVVVAQDLCQQLLDQTAPVPLRLVVLVNDLNPITLTDTVTPSPHIVSFTIQPVASQQSCEVGLTPITVTLDNTQSNVPVTWQVSSIDAVTPPGTPTPTSGEVWASVSPSTGTLAAGPNGTTAVTITQAADLCNRYLAYGATNTYNVVFTYAGNQSIVVSDTITGYSPIQ